MSSVEAEGLPNPPKGELDWAGAVLLASAALAGLAKENAGLNAALFWLPSGFLLSSVGLSLGPCPNPPKLKVGLLAAGASCLAANGDAATVEVLPTGLGLGALPKPPNAAGAAPGVAAGLLPPKPRPPNDNGVSCFSSSLAISSPKSSAPPVWGVVSLGSISSASFSSSPGGFTAGVDATADSSRRPVNAEGCEVPNAFFVASVLVLGVPKPNPEVEPDVVLEKAPKPLGVVFASEEGANAPNPPEVGFVELNGDVVLVDIPNGLDCPKAAGAGDVAIDAEPDGVDGCPKVLVPKAAG